MKGYKFIASGILCNTNQSKAEIEGKVQQMIDFNWGGYAKFKYEKLKENKVRLIYFRDLIYPGKHKVIFDSDMSLISGITVSAFQEDGYPILWPLDVIRKNYCAPTLCFLRFYSFLLHNEKQCLNEIKARMYTDRIILEIELKDGGDNYE